MDDVPVSRGASDRDGRSRLQAGEEAGGDGGGDVPAEPCVFDEDRDGQAVAVPHSGIAARRPRR